MSKSPLVGCRDCLFFLSASIIVLSSSVSLAATIKSSDSRYIFQYDFNWGFVSVASLEIDFTSHDSEGVVKSMGKTKGLSKIFKNYSARVLIQKIDESSQLYELLGLDRGVEETRKISFRKGELPRVLEFKDSNSKSSLTVRRNYDEGSVDPLSVFSWLFSKEAYSKSCNKVFRVFDGKKRFTVRIEPILTMVKPTSSKPIDQRRNRIELSDDMITCRLTMMGLSLETGESKQNSQKISFWPFNRKDQVIDINLGLRDSGMAYVHKFVVYSPIGKIIGYIRD